MDNTPLSGGQQPILPPYGNSGNGGAVSAAPAAKYDSFNNTINEFVKENKAFAAVLILFALFFGGFLLLTYGIFGGALIPVGFLIFYAVFIMLVSKDRLRFDAVSILLLLACLFLYSTYVFNSNTLTNVVTVPVVAVLTALLFMQQSGLSIEAFTFATPKEATRVYVTQALNILPSSVKAVGSRLRRKGKSTALFNILIGVACTIPFVAVLTALFASADAVFKKAVEDFFKNFGIDDVFKIIAALLLSAVVTFFVIPLLFSVVNSEEDEVVEKEKPSRLNAIAVCAFLIILTLLEGLFGAIQVRGLFAGKLPEYIVSYAEYARSGFFHIAGATALTVAIIAGIYFICGKLSVSVKIMLTVFSATATILFASAYFRMYMYMTALGLTVKRVAICWLITLLLALLIGIVIKIWLPKKFPLFGYTVVAVTLFTIVLGAMRLDTLVSKYNVDLYLNSKPEQNAQIDVDYLKELSPEALPQIVRLEGSEVDTLAKRAEQVMAYKLDQEYGKQSGINFNYGLAKAEKIVDEKKITYNYDDASYWRYGGLKYKNYDEEWEAEYGDDYGDDYRDDDSYYDKSHLTILNYYGIYNVRSDYETATEINDAEKYYVVRLAEDEVVGVEQICGYSGNFFKSDDGMYDFIFDFAKSNSTDEMAAALDADDAEYIGLYDSIRHRIVKNKTDDMPYRFTVVTYKDGVLKIYVNDVTVTLI